METLVGFICPPLWAAVTGRLVSSSFTAAVILRTISYPCSVPCMVSSLKTDQRMTEG